MPELLAILTGLYFGIALARFEIDIDAPKTRDIRVALMWPYFAGIELLVYLLKGIHWFGSTVIEMTEMSCEACNEILKGMKQ